MITRRRRTRSSGEDSDQTRVEFSSENNFNLTAVDMTTCRDRTSEFISAVKSLQSRQVKLEMSLFNWTVIFKLIVVLHLHYHYLVIYETRGTDRLTCTLVCGFLSVGYRSAVLLPVMSRLNSFRLLIRLKFNIHNVGLNLHL